MILQRIIFDKSKPSGMFYRGNISFIDNILTVDAENKLEFNTYFNSLSVEKWGKYTCVNEINVELIAKGEGVLELYCVDTDAKSKKIAGVSFKNDDFTSITFPDYFSVVDLSEITYFEITAKSKVQILYAAYICPDYDLNSINLACCFCTYKREKELIYNVKNILNNIICNPDSCLYNNCKVFIADNGHTIKSELFNNSDDIFIFENPNYGGSAGFTRCIIESCIHRQGEFTNIILMDDDAVIESYVVERTAILLQLLKDCYKDYMIGGAFFSRENPFEQHENGAVLDSNYHYSSYGSRQNMNDFKSVTSNSPEDEYISYNGWWFTVIPSSFIKSDNLPLPLFIHCDDQEYGKRANNKFIRINGICVWHPTSKMTRPYITFYDKRNKLISFASEKKSISTFQALKIFTVEFFSCFFRFLYDFSRCAADGFMFFYSGIEKLKTTNAEQLNKEIMSKYCKIHEFAIDDYSKINFSKLFFGSKERWALKSIINYFFIPVSRKKYYDISTLMRNVDFWSTNQIVFVDKDAKKAFSFKRSYLEGLKLILVYLKTCFYICIHHKKIYGEWLEKIDELKTYNFWKEYLGLS